MDDRPCVIMEDPQVVILEVCDGKSPLVTKMDNAYSEEYGGMAHPLFPNYDCRLKNAYCHAKDSDYCCGDDMIMDLLHEEPDKCVGSEATRMTPLMCALLYRRGYKVVHRLIDLETDINAESYFSQTALLLAVLNKYSKKVISEILRKGAIVTCESLFSAVYNNDLEIVQLLLEAGSDKVAYCSSGESAFLEISCDNCDKDFCNYKLMVDLLLSNNVDLKKIAENGNTVIHYVSCNYVISLAIKYGVSIETKNDEGLSPVASAILYNDFKKLNSLLLFGADPNQIDFAFTNKTIGENIDLLVYYGANIPAELTEQFYKTWDPIDLEGYRTFLCLKDTLVGIMKNWFLFHNDIFLNDERSFNERSPYLFGNCEENVRKIFVNECKIEINKMKETFITDSVTFFEFCCLKRVKKSKFINISLGEHELIYKKVRELFPIFEHLIIMRVRDNHKEKFKRVLMKNFEKFSIHPRLMSEPNINFSLDYDSLYCVCKYLSHSQLYKLFSLFVNSNDSLIEWDSKSQERSNDSKRFFGPRLFRLSPFVPINNR